MADVSKIRPSGGTTTYDIKDATARTNASNALSYGTLDLQVANDVYAGRAITGIAELASEISSAGNVYAFLHNRAAAGNFANLRIGDYIDVPVTGYGTIRYRIGAFDHYYNCGDSAMPHHIVFVPNAPITMPSSSSYTVNNSYIMWNTTADNNGTSEESNPYLASNLHAWEIGEFLPALPSALQGYLKNFRDLVETRYDANSKLTDSTGWKWADLGKVWSPSEMEVYGTRVWGTEGWSQGLGSQFPIFRNTRDRIRGGRVTWWLRITRGGSSSAVCTVGNNGSAHYTSAANTGIRPLPCFLLG